MAAKILIDAISMSHPQPGGYRTYTSNLVQHLQLVDQRNNYVVAVDRPVAWTANPGWELRILERRGSVGVIWREQMAIPRLARQANADLIHSPAATAPLWGATPLLVTIHDTIEFSEPLPSPKQPKRWGMRLYSRFAQSRAAQNARHILTVSHYSKEHIANLFSIPKERITVVHNAPSPVFSTCNQVSAKEVVARCWSISDHVLGIASAAKRKNMGALLGAYTLLPEQIRSAHPLALVCTHSGVKAHIAALAEKTGLRDPIRLLENVSDSELALLYNAASAFVFPSLEEGFGLPPLEAMTCGAPVIASNTSSLPEVLGDAAILVSPTNTTALVDALKHVLTDRALAAEMRERGLAHSQHFSWKRAALEVMAVYELIGAAPRTSVK